MHRILAVPLFVVLMISSSMGQGVARIFLDLSGPYDEPPPLTEPTPYSPTSPNTSLVADAGQYIRVTLGIDLDFRNTDRWLTIGNFFMDFADSLPDDSNEQYLEIHRYGIDPRMNARVHPDFDYSNLRIMTAAAGTLYANSLRPWDSSFDLATGHGAGFKIGFAGGMQHVPPTFVGHFLLRVREDTPYGTEVVISTTRLSPVGQEGVTLRTCLLNANWVTYPHDQGTVEVAGAYLTPEPASMMALMLGLGLLGRRRER